MINKRKILFKHKQTPEEIFISSGMRYYKKRKRMDIQLEKRYKWIDKKCSKLIRSVRILHKPVNINLQNILKSHESWEIGFDKCVNIEVTE